MDYLSEVKKLPQDIQDILLSAFGAQINQKITDKYKLSAEQGLNMMRLVNDIYIKEISVDKLIKKLQSNLNFDEQKAKKLALDIAGMKLLIADNYFNNEIKKYIANQGSNVDEYKEIVAKEMEELKKEQEQYAKDIEPDEFPPEPQKQSTDLGAPVTELSLVEKKKRLNEVFTEHLVSLLLLNDSNEFVEEINNEIIDLIVEEHKVKQEFINLILVNDEKLTHSEFILNNKPTKPTIANWLKDFVYKNGAEMFDNVALSTYITDSPNTRNLEEEERMLVRKLLLLYRNLAFFPESMPADEASWEIIPIEREEVLNRVKKQISEENSLEELRELAKDYPENSLERRAIEEEIAKFQISDFKLQNDK
ncbi:MAG: hypothetical protein Q8Q23_04915 [bacterium]|nr:hypothetical protein [bacterium]